MLHTAPLLLEIVQQPILRLQQTDGYTPAFRCLCLHHKPGFNGKGSAASLLSAMTCFGALSGGHLAQISSSGKDRVQFQNLLSFKVWILFHHMKALGFQQSHDFHHAALVAIVNFDNSLQALKTLISRNVKSND